MKDYNELIRIISEHEPGLAGIGEIYHGAVCIPLITEAGRTEVLFEIRSKHIQGQPGDVCFPGGGIEMGEEPEEAVIRECCEELLIEPGQINIIGQADIFHTESAIIYPFVGELIDYKWTFSECEVEKVFTVPVEFFADTEPERYRVDALVQPGEDFPYHRIQGGRNYKWRSRSADQLFYEYDGITIWGLTARVMYSFVKLIR